MSYGLIVKGEDGSEWFNSTTSFGFIEIANFAVATDGSTGNSASGSIPGYSNIFPVYVANDVVNDVDSDNTVRPILSNTFNVSTGAWSVTQTWSGDNSGTAAVSGGRVIIFAH